MKAFLLIFFLVFAALTPGSASAVTVGPVKLEYAADPGTIITGTLYIKNEESVPKTLYPGVDQFTEQNGEKTFLKEQGLISKWFKTVDSIALKAGESEEMPFTITIPSDAPPGGQFAVIWWSTTAPATSDAQNVSIQTRAGILVYINVSGDITESAKITSFDTVESKTFFGKTSVPLSLNVMNDGNVYIKPKGTITVTSFFGPKVFQAPINSKGLQILPQSYRIFSDTIWNGSYFTFGPYKIEATVRYGSNNQSNLVASRWVWLFPLNLIFTVLGIALGLIIVLAGFFKFYNRWIIKKYGNDGEK